MAQIDIVSYTPIVIWTFVLFLGFFLILLVIILPVNVGLIKKSFKTKVAFLNITNVMLIKLFQVFVFKTRLCNLFKTKWKSFSK